MLSLLDDNGIVLGVLGVRVVKLAASCGCSLVCACLSIGHVRLQINAPFDFRLHKNERV